MSQDELSTAEEKRARRMRNEVRAKCPWMIRVIRDLVDNELIEGWRNVISVRPADAPRPPLNAINAAVFLENSKPMNTK